MSAPAKYARIRSKQNRDWKGMGLRGERYYESVRGGDKPVVGGSLIALDARLAAIKPTPPQASQAARNLFGESVNLAKRQGRGKPDESEKK